MTSDIEDIRKDLLVARVLSVDEAAGRLYLRFRKGLVGTVDVFDAFRFPKGCVVTVDAEDLTIELAPDEVWEEESWVGVVRLIKGEKTVVSTGSLPHLVPTRGDTPYEVGNTVEVKDEYGVVEVLSEKPLDLSDDDVSSSRFEYESRPGGETYEDFGGFGEVVAQVKELEGALANNGALAAMGGRPVKGVLFVGPPGTGKTMLARIVANQTESKFYEVRGPEVVSKYSGDTERTLRNIFDTAAQQDRAIIFLDEIDSIAGSRDTLTHDFSRSVVAQLLTLMDGFEPTTNVLVIGATNRPDALDSALRRPGRFDLEIEFAPPNEHDREEILRSAARKQANSESLPHGLIAKRTASWTPAELAGIWHMAARVAFAEGRAEVDTEDYLIGYEQAAAQRRRKSPRSGEVAS